MRLVGRAHNDQLNLGIGEYIVERSVNFNRSTKPLLDFATLRRRVTFKNSIESKEFRESEDEGDVEGETS